MAVEGLHSETSAHVPDGQGTVCGSTHEEVGEWLEIEGIHRVSVGTVLLPHFQGMQVPKLNRSISSSRENKVTGVVELGFPDWAGVGGFKGVGNGRVYEIPEFDAVVRASSDQVRSYGMEVNSRQPVLVAFTSHNVFSRVHVPDFPRAVVGNSSNNLFAHVQGKARDGSGVSLHPLAGSHTSSNGFVGPRQVGVRTGIFRVGSVFGDSHA